MKEITGTCKFCGQRRLIVVPDNADEELILEETALSCTCKESHAYRDAKEKEEQIEMAKTSARGTTFKLFHEEYPEIEELLNMAIDPLVNKKFKKMTINTGGRVKATISFSKDSIKVEREDKSVATREADV